MFWLRELQLEELTVIINNKPELIIASLAIPISKLYILNWTSITSLSDVLLRCSAEQMGKLIRDTDRCAEQMPFIRPKAGAGLIFKDCFSGIVFHSPKWKQHVEEIVMLLIPLHTTIFFQLQTQSLKNYLMRSSIILLNRVLLQCILLGSQENRCYWRTSTKNGIHI